MKDVHLAAHSTSLERSNFVTTVFHPSMDAQAILPTPRGGTVCLVNETKQIKMTFT